LMIRLRTVFSDDVSDLAYEHFVTSVTSHGPL
jgi:hypothetical protein